VPTAPTDATSAKSVGLGPISCPATRSCTAFGAYRSDDHFALKLVNEVYVGQ
jgi:hypothetical protein